MLKVRIENVFVITFHYFLLTTGDTDPKIPPSITRNPKAEVFYRPSETVTVKCKAKGSPPVKYTWTRNGVEIKDDGNEYEPNIDIGDGTTEGEGIYQCAASNTYGTALSDKSHVQMVIMPEIVKPSRPKKNEQMTVTEGQPFSIVAPRIRSVPKFNKVQWLKFCQDGKGGYETSSQTIQPSKRIQVAANGDLHFAYAIPEDELVTYQPIYKGKYGEYGGSCKNITVLRVGNNSMREEPTLRFFKEQNVAFVGRNASLRCFFSGYPQPNILWTLPSNSHFSSRHQLNLNETELLIVNVEAADEGQYHCAASTNNVGFNFHVRVVALPSFHRKSDRPHNIDAIEGSTATFVCNPDAKPEAMIDWFQNGKLIDVNDPPRRFEISDDKKRLTIKYVSPKCSDRETKTDLMVIQCNASNVYGYAFVSGYLNVFAIPGSEGAMLVDWWIVLVASVSTGILLFVVGLCTALRCKQRKKYRVVKRRNQVEYRMRNIPDSLYEIVRDEAVSQQPIGGASVTRPVLQASFNESQSARPLVCLPAESEQPGTECHYYSQMNDRSPSVSGSDGYAPMKQPCYLMLTD